MSLDPGTSCGSPLRGSDLPHPLRMGVQGSLLPQKGYLSPRIRYNYSHQSFVIRDLFL
jgi:hypothetical protein